METSQTWDLYQATTQEHTFDVNSVEDLASRGDLKSLVEKQLTTRDVNQRDRFGLTPLMIAAYAAQVEVVKYLLELGADPNVGDFGGNTALMGVTFMGDVELARLLLQYQADANQHNVRGLGARDLAMMFGKLEIVKLMDFYADAKAWSQPRSLLDRYALLYRARVAS